MGHRSNDAAVMDAPIELGEEECAVGTARRSNDAAVGDAQTSLRKEEYA